MAAIQRPAIPSLKAPRFPRPGRLVAVAVLALVVAVALLQVNQFSAVTGAGYEIENLQRQRAMKQAANHQVEAQVAELSSLAHVDREARGKLGMVPPSHTVNIRIEVPVPDHQTLPTRFLPRQRTGDQAIREQPLWMRLIGLLP